MTSIFDAEAWTPRQHRPAPRPPVSPPAMQGQAAFVEAGRVASAALKSRVMKTGPEPRATCRNRAQEYELARDKLLAVIAAGHVSFVEVVAHSGINGPSASNRLTRMTKEGLIERHHYTRPTKHTAYTITPIGMELVK